MTIIEDRSICLSDEECVISGGRFFLQRAGETFYGLPHTTWYPATIGRTRCANPGMRNNELAIRACTVYRVRRGRLKRKLRPKEASTILLNSQYDKFRFPTYGTPSLNRTYESISRRGSQPSAHRFT